MRTRSCRALQQRYKMKDFYPQAKGKPSLADKGLEHHIFISLTDVKRKCWKQKKGGEKEYKSPKGESDTLDRAGAMEMGTREQVWG